MVPEHLVEHTCLDPLMLLLESSKDGLANAKEKEDKDYGAEHFVNLKLLNEKFKIIEFEI